MGSTLDEDKRALGWTAGRAYGNCPESPKDNVIQTQHQVSKGKSMPNEEWGTKRLCPTTGKRFYDLNKSPIISPYTGEEVTVDQSKSRMIAADAEDAATTKAKVAEVSNEDDLVDDDDVDGDLDDDLLDDDEDDDDTVPLDEIADVASNDDER
jgi:hypothetical protein